MKNIQFVTAVHGNEFMPTLALASMGVKQIVANPRALARGARYVERDLNASFGMRGKSYEERRARELTKLLDPRKLVVDLHTFPCESEPFAIVVDLAMIPLAARLGVNHVVYMKYNIKAGHSLINYRKGVSVEVGKHTDPRSFETTLNLVRRLGVKVPKIDKVRVYEVYGRIEEPGQFTNFVECGGMVPVLYGEATYHDYGCYGLAAREITGTIEQEENI